MYYNKKPIIAAIIVIFIGAAVAGGWFLTRGKKGNDAANANTNNVNSPFVPLENINASNNNADANNLNDNSAADNKNIAIDSKNINSSIANANVAQNANSAVNGSVNSNRPKIFYANFPPEFADSDHDGLMDSKEKEIGTDPNNQDTDGDGLVDGGELDKIIGTDPLKADTDGDGYNDRDELLAGYDPKKPNAKDAGPKFTTPPANVSR